jgi:predicted membrane protein
MFGKLIPGIVLILLGAAFLLDEFEVVSFEDVINWWPIVFVIMGLYEIFARKNFIGGSVIGVIGLLLLITMLDVFDWSMWGYIWPVLLIVIGLYIIFPKGSDLKNVSSEEKISEVAIFSGVQRSIMSKNFKGGSVTSIFGGCEIDMRDAEIKEDGVELEIISIFGGSEITVPKNWKIHSSGIPLFGGFEDGTNKNKDEVDKTKILKVRYTSIFGGSEIKN